jgi:glycogen debranching enzyme
VWSWILGAYVDALIKLGIDKALVKNVIDNFTYHLNEGCLGSVSEIFDANFPHTPKGCIAEAWGVAEILRVINDHNLIAEQKTISQTEAKEMVKDDAQKIVGSIQ